MPSSVTGVSPSSGPASGGTSVVLYGSGFTGATAVHFGATTAGFGVISDTQIMAGSPAHAAGTVDVIVTAPSGTSPANSADQFTFQAAPTVTAVRPNSGPTAGGGTVEIDGTGFYGASAVVFGGTNAPYYSVQSDTVIMAQAPPHAAGVVDVAVTAQGGQSAINASDQYTYQTASGPVVTAVTPSSGSTAGGNSVEIDGSGFTSASSVAFGAAAANYRVSSDSVIIAQTPAHAAGVVDVVVTAQGVASPTSSADHYNYVTPPPVVTGLSPDSGTTAGGTSLEISGSGFTGASAVSFGATAAAGFTVVDDTEIIATTPAEAAGVVDVVVTAFGVVSAVVPADHFAFVKPTIQITNTPSALGNNVNISQRARTQAEESIAINPTSPNHLFVASVDGASNGLFAATLDRTGGNTWVGRVIADGEPAFAVGTTPAGSGDSLPRASGDPSVAYDQFGNLFLTYLTPKTTPADLTPVSQVGLVTSLAAFNAPNKLTDTNHTWATDEWKGCLLQITAGPGNGPTVYTIAGNTASQLTIAGTWPVGGTPDVGSKYIIMLPQKRVVLADSTDNGKTFQFFGWVALGADGAAENTVDQPTVTTGPGTNLQPARNATAFGINTLTDAAQMWAVNQWVGDEVAIVSGTGAGQVRKIIGNTANTLTIDQPWGELPNGAQYTIRISAASVWVSWGFSRVNNITTADERLVAARGATVDGLGVFGSFQAIEEITDSVGGEFADPQVGPDGRLLVTYQTDVNPDKVNPNKKLANIYTALDPDGLGPALFIVPPGGRPVAAQTHVGLHYKLPAAGNNSIDAEPTLAWDISGLHHPGSDGRVYLVYTDVNPRTDAMGKLLSPNDTFIAVQYSNDSGVTWMPTPAQQANDRNGNSQFLPAAAVDPTTGWLALSWYDARKDPGNVLSQIFGTVASGTLTADLKLTFLPDVQIGTLSSNAAASGDNFGFGDYTGLAFYDKTFFPAWADNSNSTGNNPDTPAGAAPSGPMDVYTAEVDVAAVRPPPAPPPAPPGGAAPAITSVARPSLMAPLQPVVPAAMADPTTSAPIHKLTSKTAPYAGAGPDLAAYAGLSAGPPPLTAPPTALTPQPRPPSGPSGTLLPTAVGRDHDLVFQDLSAGLNPRIAAMWLVESAADAGEFDTDSWDFWG